MPSAKIAIHLKKLRKLWRDSARVTDKGEIVRKSIDAEKPAAGAISSVTSLLLQESLCF
jgi:hypothetical protein